MSGPFLDVRNLRVSIPLEQGLLMPVRGVDLAVSKGETLFLVGESGCGKSMTAMALMGLLPRKARIEADLLQIDGVDYAADPRRGLSRLAGRKMAMIFQDPMSSLNPTLTIGRQLTEGVVATGQMQRREAQGRALDLLDRVGIPQPERRMRQYPHELSGGQRQRVMIAMALMGKPGLLIADEPTTALDVTIQAQILALLARIQAELGLAILFITHDLGVVAAIADRVSVMYAGRIVEAAPVAPLFDAPAHPYTRGLIGAIPVPGKVAPGSDLAAIPGRVPELIGGITGCAFRSRCEHARDACARDPIPIRRFGEDRMTECVLTPGDAAS